MERGNDGERRENNINRTVDMAVCVAAVSLNEELVLPAEPDSVLLMLVILSKEPCRHKDDPDYAAHRDHWTHFLGEVQKTWDMTEIYACLCGNKVSQANIERFSTVH